MRWKHARQSSNVEDRRGRGHQVAMGGGIGGIIIALIAVFFFNADPTMLSESLTSSTPTKSKDYQPSAAENELAAEAGAVLGFTEDVWNRIFPMAAQGYRKSAKTTSYVKPDLVLFTDIVNSGCGKASSGMGPFYCPADSKVYIDLSFFEQLKRDFGAAGDFARAYVIAHEVGHHVQNLLGLSDYVHRQRVRLSDEEYNQLSVRLELQADYFAGVWAHQTEKLELQREGRGFLERGDLEEGMRAASAVGDDTIQKRQRGWVQPESFTHGTSEQRTRWFRLGLKTGDPLAHSPFELPYDQL
ncbi:MAG: neutral zinc metallopeptidase [Verrucomicrobiota bacterium]